MTTGLRSGQAARTRAQGAAAQQSGTGREALQRATVARATVTLNANRVQKGGGPTAQTGAAKPSSGAATAGQTAVNNN